MDKIVFALNLIVDFIDSNELITEKNISDYLVISGFDDYEIRQVLALLDMKNSDTLTCYRAFTKSEGHYLTQEVQNYLNKLILLGVLDIFSAEDIIEKALDSGDLKIPIERIKEFVLCQILEKYHASHVDEQYIDEYVQ